MSNVLTSMTNNDFSLYESLIGTERYIGDQWLHLTAILSVRELVVLYHAILDNNDVKIPVVAKASMNYIINGEPFLPEIELESQIHQDTYNYAVNHNIVPRIPKYYGLFDDDQYPITYYVMESLGPNLFNLHDMLLEDVAVDIITALKTVHQAGYFHRDITPFNILNTSDNHSILIDFGLSISTSDVDPIDDDIYLRVGNPMFAPMIAFRGSYNFGGDLEGLCYTLEMIYGEPLPWNRNRSERGYRLRERYSPSNVKVRNLFEYLKTIGEEMPDYELCMDFFLNDI